MNRRQVVKAETRQLILDATKKILVKNSAFTMREVAAEAGVSPASVVVHFNTKTRLLEAALYEDIEHTILKAIASIPQDRPLLDRLMHIWCSMFRFYDTNRILYRELLRRTTFEPDSESPHLKEQVDRFLGFLDLVIRDEQAKGSIETALESMMVAESLGAFYFGMLIRFFKNPQMTPQAAIEYLTKITNQYLGGIQPRPKREDKSVSDPQKN